MNNFLNLNEITQKNLEAILEDACEVKKATLGGAALKTRYSSCLKNKLTGLFFEKLSTRTRLSFEAAILKLGGRTLNLRKDEIHMGRDDGFLRGSAYLRGICGCVLSRHPRRTCPC